MADSDKTEYVLVRDHVDKDQLVDQASEPDEAAVLREAYGEPDADGIYRGDGA